MVNVKQALARRSGMAERAAALMAIHFSEISEAWLWQRSKTKGFTTVPRTLPITMEAVDHLSKGQPAGHTLFCLWARAPDGPMVIIENPATFAAEAGFTGARAIDTWRRRMKVLRDHQFLIPKKGPSGDFHYVLLLNPNVAVEYLRHEGKVQDDLYGRFKDRLAEVGASSEMDVYYAYCAAVAQVQADAEKAVELTAEQLAAIPKPPKTAPPAPQKTAGKAPAKKVVRRKPKASAPP